VFGAATGGEQRCYTRLPLLLPAASRAATYGVRCCYRRRAALLHMASIAATGGEQGCYIQRSALLPWVSDLLPWWGGVCRSWPSPELGGEAASMGGRGCYNGVGLLLPLADGGASTGPRRSWTADCHWPSSEMDGDPCRCYNKPPMLLQPATGAATRG